jgi:hypothetical protein
MLCKLNIAPKGAFIMMNDRGKPKKLLDQVRDTLRVIGLTSGEPQLVVKHQKGVIMPSPKT